MTRRFSLAYLFAVCLLPPTAQADVHFGSHVYIGGHDVSHQTFNRHRRAVYYLYNRRPHPEGCAWRRNGDGSQTKVCRLQTLR